MSLTIHCATKHEVEWDADASDFDYACEALTSALQRLGFEIYFANSEDETSNFSLDADAVNKYLLQAHRKIMYSDAPLIRNTLYYNHLTKVRINEMDIYTWLKKVYAKADKRSGEIYFTWF